jgi:hypothetical protein
MDIQDQWRVDNRRLQECVWENRAENLDYLLLHDCGIAETVAAGIRHVAWTIEEFVAAALKDDRELLHFTDPEA